MRLLCVLGLLVACKGGQDSDPQETGGACGAVTEHTISVEVTVDDGSDAPVEGATVRLEERAWEPGTLGEGTTDAQGQVTLADLSITSVEDCWGTVLDYQLVVEKDPASTEVRLNSALFNAVQSGEQVVRRDVSLE